LIGPLNSRESDVTIFSEGMVIMTIPFGSGGPQEQACLRLNLLPGWLVKIDASRVKESLRDRVQLYQRECYDVLYRHFFGVAAMQSPGYERRSIEMVKQARLIFGRPAGARVWRERGLPMVPEMDEVFNQLDLFAKKKVA
jgi:hypothetical protein